MRLLCGACWPEFVSSCDAARRMTTVRRSQVWPLADHVQRNLKPEFPAESSEKPGYFGGVDAVFAEQVAVLVGVDLVW